MSAYIKAFHNVNTGSQFYKWLDEFTNKVRELRKEGTMFDETTVLPVDGNDIMKVFNLKPSKNVKLMLDIAWEIYLSHPEYSKDDLVSSIVHSNIICG